jgi:hypothetical protein
MAKADLDRPVRVADAIAAPDAGPLGRDRAIVKAEAAREPLCIEVEALDQPSCGIAIQVGASLPTPCGPVNGAPHLSW